MRKPIDPLYSIFERYLYNSFLEHEEQATFVDKVVDDYLAHMQTKATIPPHLVESVENDLKEEVLEMLRKKIYGHFNLRSFRETQDDTKQATDAKPSGSQIFRPKPRTS